MKRVGKLEITTPSDREIVMTRAFGAPASLVWEAYTRPEHLQRWLGVHNGWTFPVCEMDFRVGGSYRWVWRSPTGYEMGMGGVYREIVPVYASSPRRSSTIPGTKARPKAPSSSASTQG